MVKSIFSFQLQRKAFTMPMPCIPNISAAVALIDGIICLLSMVIWYGKSQFFIAIFKIVLQIVEFVSFWYIERYQDYFENDPNKQHDSKRYWCGVAVTALHLIPLIWICAVTLPNIDLHTGKHCIDNEYILHIAFMSWVIIMVSIRIVMHCIIKTLSLICGTQ